MKTPFPYQLRKQQLWLSSDRCIFWEEARVLIVSDLHFGKTGHFRKAGIAVPQSVYREDLQRLVAQIQYFQPRRIFIVGDLFHSQANKELELFKRWRGDFPDLSFSLIKGNHDILEDRWYEEACIEVHQDNLLEDSFCFVHDITLMNGNPLRRSAYSFSGHIHPGIRINGLGKQSLHFPCFYFGKDYAVLPAFSRFTGVALIDPDPGEHVFAIVDKKIMQLQ